MKTINGTHGSNQTPCTIFVDDDGWYAVEGSKNVNQTQLDGLTEGVDVELLVDVDYFSWGGDPINSEEEFQRALDA